jgi:hypothetical protein
VEDLLHNHVWGVFDRLRDDLALDPAAIPREEQNRVQARILQVSFVSYYIKDPVLSTLRVEWGHVGSSLHKDTPHTDHR